MSNNPRPKPNKTQAKADRFEAELAHAVKTCKLDGWNDLADEVKLPPDIFAALFTGRPEMLKVLKPRDMTAEEVAALFAILANLIETNAALRYHAQMVAQLVDNWSEAFGHLHSLGNKVKRFASFDKAYDEGDHYA